MAIGKNWICQLDEIYQRCDISGSWFISQHGMLFVFLLMRGGSIRNFHKSTKSCIGHVPGVTSVLTPSGIRVSAAYHIPQQPILNIDGEIVRGGWSFEGESRLFY